MEIEKYSIGGNTVSFRRVGSGPRKILFFHGFPGSSRQVEVFKQHVENLGLEVVCIDRPGYGYTSSQENDQSISTNFWSNHLINEFGWTEYEAISVSGGTPFLFPFVKSARLKPRRVTAVSGLGPIQHRNFRSLMSLQARAALKFLPLVPERMRDQLVISITSKAVFNDQFTSGYKFLSYFLPASPADRELMEHPEVHRAMAQGLKESVMQGGRGIARDAAAYVKPWSLDLGDYSGPVYFWHGRDDKIVPFEMSDKMAAQFRGQSGLKIRSKTLDSEGHYSLIIRRLPEILASDS